MSCGLISNARNVLNFNCYEFSGWTGDPLVQRWRLNLLRRYLQSGVNFGYDYSRKFRAAPTAWFYQVITKSSC